MYGFLIVKWPLYWTPREHGREHGRVRSFPRVLACVPCCLLFVPRAVSVERVSVAIHTTGGHLNGDSTRERDLCFVFLRACHLFALPLGRLEEREGVVLASCPLRVFLFVFFPHYSLRCRCEMRLFSGNGPRGGFGLVLLSETNHFALVSTPPMWLPFAGGCLGESCRRSGP